MPRSLADAARSSRREAPGILAFVGVICATFFLQDALGLLDFALEARTRRGLAGIVLMPFLHGDLEHLTSNALPLTVLLFLLAGSRARSSLVVVSLLLTSGFALWLSGASGVRYVGASMLIFALLAFLILSGFLERRLVPLLVACIVAVLYGSAAPRGLLDFRPEVSEYAHFVGAAIGAIAAALLVRRPARKVSAY